MSYDDKEKNALHELALRTLVDKRATPDDRIAARERLLVPALNPGEVLARMPQDEVQIFLAGVTLYNMHAGVRTTSEHDRRALLRDVRAAVERLLGT